MKQTFPRKYPGSKYFRDASADWKLQQNKTKQNEALLHRIMFELVFNLKYKIFWTTYVRGIGILFLHDDIKFLLHETSKSEVSCSVWVKVTLQGFLSTGDLVLKRTEWDQNELLIVRVNHCHHQHHGDHGICLGCPNHLGTS